LADAIDCLEDSLRATEKVLNDERAARGLADDLLVRVLAGLNREKAVRKAYKIVEARMAYRMIV
jgi:hypothetical protein